MKPEAFDVICKKHQIISDFLMAHTKNSGPAALSAAVMIGVLHRETLDAVKPFVEKVPNFAPTNGEEGNG